MSRVIKYKNKSIGRREVIVDASISGAQIKALRRLGYNLIFELKGGHNVDLGELARIAASK